ncbi:MAG: HAD family phosphatase, partial [Thermofilaceae archaeon]
MHHYKLLVLDVDGVLTKTSSIWQYLHTLFGTKEKAVSTAEAFKQGRITYEDWARLDAALWKGRKLDELQKALHDIEIREGARELIILAKKKGLYTLAISAGLGFITNEVVEELGIDHQMSNELEIINNTLTGRVFIRVTYSNKGDLLADFCNRFSIKLSETIVIGDNEVDIPMLRLAGLAIAFNPLSPLVITSSHLTVESSTLFPI